MDHFTLDNTQGYNQEDLNELNAKLDACITDDGCEPYTPEWYELCKRFADTVASRIL